MKKKLVIWGTGVYARRFTVNYNDNEIAFFIDSDIKKRGTCFQNKLVYHPSDIDPESFNRYFLYIPENYKSEISEYLNDRKLVWGKDYDTYSSRLHVSRNMAEIDFQRYKNELDRLRKDYDTIIFATFWSKYGYMNLFSIWKEEYLIISEMAGFNSDEIRRELSDNSIQAPIFADYETIIDCDDEIGEIDSEENKLLEQATQQMIGYFPTESYEKCRYTAWMKYQYILYTLNFFDTKNILAFSSVTVEHELLHAFCKKRGINEIFTHPGLIHGTISFDAYGEMGESIPTMYPDQFLDLEVNAQDIYKAKEVLQFLRDSKINRKIQPKEIGLCKDPFFTSGKPIILFAGQNDVGSHMVPYTDRTKAFHSPVFKSSIEAAVYLAELCEKNNWQFVYKPHPMYARIDDEKILPPSVYYLRYGDINEAIDNADVVVTILSTSNYDALIRKKPVVVLGYMQSKGKGINYEAFSKEAIEGMIQQALAYGYTKEIEYNFVKHVAQCLKYYLYDNGEKREVRYGQAFPTSYNDFFKLQKLIEHKMKGNLDEFN